MHSNTRRWSGLFSLLLLLVLGTAVQAKETSDRIEFTQETLDNGLQVIYAPLHQAPVVHVRVLYHVGSRDERPDRQGFAHMFEHMMFRGSAHVKPEEHMKLVGVVGGISNAFTSFDETVYHDTIPAGALDMTLYLEADRMASFKVSEDIFKTERKVVAEEWRMRQNQPYGNSYELFLKNAFKQHSYRWTPIGNMDQLRAARTNELQDFFNTYYLPNNAVLVIAGDIDVDATRAMVKKYFGWIPPGPKVQRHIAEEPPQSGARRAVEADRVPLPAVLIGFRLPSYRSEDYEALSLLADVMGAGRSSRLSKLLVTGDHPQAVSATASPMRLEDAGEFLLRAVVMQGRDPDAVEKALNEAARGAVEHGVTQEELDKAKTQERVALVEGRETATELAAQLGEEAMFGGDANRVNTELARLDAVTLADVQRVAKKYLEPKNSTTLRIMPDPLGTQARNAATQSAMDVPVVPPSEPVKPRDVQFPPGYPVNAALAQVTTKAHFEKGTETTIGGVRVIVMPDSRLPLVTWNLTTRHGSYEDAKGKEGLSSLTASMLRRGAGSLSFAQLSEDLESRGISLEVADGGDFSRISGSCIKSELDHAMQRTRDVLLSPTFPEAEFKKLQEQTVNQLRLAQESPTAVAGEELAAAMYGDSPLGRHATPASVQALTLMDVKRTYLLNFVSRDLILVLSGDVTVERGQQLAKGLLEGWKAQRQASADQYRAAQAPVKRRVLLVDRPGGKQATVRLAVPAYDIRSDEKFAGSIAGQLLSSGIDSRLGRYVRAEKGLAYTVTGLFQPGRHGGVFLGSTETAVESSADSIEAIFKVLDDMRKADVSDEELAQAKTRVAGRMLMEMQTIQQQAGFRVDAILNGYPVDYYDNYPARVGEVTAEQVRQVMRKYVDDGRMTIVVVAPAEAVKEQLKRIGDVEVTPMPSKRAGPTSKSAPELLKPDR